MPDPRRLACGGIELLLAQALILALPRVQGFAELRLGRRHGFKLHASLAELQPRWPSDR